MRSDAKKQARNRANLSQLKTLNQKLQGLSGNPEEAKNFAIKVISRYDRAVSKGIIPRKRADRKKSRISKFVAKLGNPNITVKEAKD